MREELLDRLRELTEEEQTRHTGTDPEGRALYAKSGRFIIERRRMSALSSGESTAAISLRPHPRFREFPVHSHDYVELMYVCCGTVTHRIGEETVTLEADDLLLLGKDTRHSILPAGEGYVGMNLIVSADLFESLLRSMRSSSRLSAGILEDVLRRDGLPFAVFHGRESLGLRNLMESMISSALWEKNAGPYLLQQSMALLLGYLAAMSRDSEGERGTEEDLMKKRILDYIRTSYSTATLTEAARMLGLSAPYLSRLCHLRFGESFKELLMRERFSAACDLLSSTEMPVGDIINRVGYENSSYFHKEFKRRLGMTPKEYRKQNQ